MIAIRTMDGGELEFECPEGVKQKNIIQALSRQKRGIPPSSVVFGLSPREKEFFHRVVGAVSAHNAEVHANQARRALRLRVVLRVVKWSIAGFAAAAGGAYAVGAWLWH